MSLLTLRPAAPALVCAIAISCSDTAAIPLPDDLDEAPYASIAAVSETYQETLVGSEALSVPRVIVRLHNGAPLPGAAVTFSVEQGNGAIVGGDARTNSGGIAAVGSWTIGTTAGLNVVEARLGDSDPIVFTALGKPGSK
jgi:hypothetical protein